MSKKTEGEESRGEMRVRSRRFPLSRERYFTLSLPHLHKPPSFSCTTFLFFLPWVHKIPRPFLTHPQATTLFLSSSLSRTEEKHATDREACHADRKDAQELVRSRGGAHTAHQAGHESEKEKNERKDREESRKSKTGRALIQTCCSRSQRQEQSPRA